MKSKFVAITMAISMLTGCASVKYNYDPEQIEVSEPPLGSIITAYVGEILLRQGKFRMHDAVVLREDVEVGAIAGYTMYAGEYLKHGEDKKAAYYMPGATSNPGRIEKCALCDPFKAVMVYRDEPKVCGVSVFNAMTCRSGVDLERTQLPVLTTDSFQQTLIYSGKVGNKINIGYREFSSNIARPAFNNDVEYDLGESSTIGYKGARLEVVEATNEYIKYRVIRNFNTELAGSVASD